MAAAWEPCSCSRLQEQCLTHQRCAAQHEHAPILLHSLQRTCACGAAATAPSVQDVIKSKLQCQSYKWPQYRGILDCGAQLYRAGGVACLYKGLGPCLVRAAPANGIAFLLYEQTAALLTAQAA